jgi:VWFA-related protein
VLKTVFRAFAVSLAGAVVAASQQQAPPPTPPPLPQQQPVFRGRIETVSVPVSVFDRYDTIVTRLEKDDFTVLDDGAKQEITQFSSGLQPIRAVALVDVSASMMPTYDLAMLAAEQFVIRLRPDDKARVGLFNVKTRLSPEFTSDRDALLRWLRQVPPFSNPTKLLDAINEAITELLPEQGRRVVLVFTDGCDTASETSWNTVLRRIYSEDVMVYAIMFRPKIILKAPPERTMNFGSARGAMGGGRGGNSNPFPCTLDHWLELSNATPLSDFFKIDDPRWTRGAQLIHQLASETGGGRINLAPADEVNRLFTGIMNELHYMYLLGYTPPKSDGKLHEIKVKVKNPELVIRARQHYLAPPPPPNPRRPG